MSDALFMKAGGRKSHLFGADPNDPASVTWNFGIFAKPPELIRKIESRPTFYERFPKLKGKWDGKTTINHFAAADKILGDKATDLIQYQPRGTCGGRAGSATGDFVQLVMKAAGKPLKFKRTSHAAVYYGARKLYNMLEGRWNDDSQDGVASGAVPEALSKLSGYVGRDECGDEKYYGAGSDDLACKLGAGMMTDVAEKILVAGEDNKLADWAVVNSAAEAADGIAAGGILIGSDSQGFTMARDKNGFCSPSGIWYHYHTRVSVGVWGGRKGFGYWQSWGNNAPSGTALKDHPGNCFAVDWETQDRCIKNGDYAIVFGFNPIEMEEDKIVVDWKF